jgi:hypothetical protein
MIVLGCSFDAWPTEPLVEVLPEKGECSAEEGVEVVGESMEDPKNLQSCSKGPCKLGTRNVSSVRGARE